MDCRLLIRLTLLLAMSVVPAGRISAQEAISSDTEVDADKASESVYPLRPNAEVVGTSTVDVAQYAPGITPLSPPEQPVAYDSYAADVDRPVGYRDLFPLYGNDPTLQGLAPISDEIRSYGVLLSVDYESFRGVPDGAWGNNGIHTGFNFASSLGQFSELTGFGVQAGATVGIYDWAGTDYRLQNRNGAETQGFFTYGLYRKPTEDSRMTAALVQDWSVNDTFSVFGQSPTLSQLRGQLGYAVSASNEFGVWGTAHVLSSTHDVTGFGPVKWQSINQLSAYWHHKWNAGGPDTWVSIGAPEASRLAGGGSVGDYLVNLSAVSPLSDAVSIYTNATYMHQSAGLGGMAARDDAWDFIVGISIYPQRNARSKTVAGQRWMPLLPVANNGSFLVDASKNF